MNILKVQLFECILMQLRVHIKAYVEAKFQKKYKRQLQRLFLL